MRPGLVVTIRVNPKDCQSVLAMMKVSGLDTSKETFSSMVSTVFSGLLQATRTNKTIEEPDATRYWNQMGRYHKSEKGKSRSAIANTIREQIKVAVRDVEEDDDTPAEAIDPKVKLAGIRMQQLMDKEEQTPELYTVDDKIEFKELYKIVYPDG